MVLKNTEGARSHAVSCRHIRTTLSAMLLHAALPTAFGGAADGARRRCRRRCDGGAAAEPVRRLCTAPGLLSSWQSSCNDGGSFFILNSERF